MPNTPNNASSMSMCPRILGNFSGYLGPTRLPFGQSSQLPGAIMAMYAKQLACRRPPHAGTPVNQPAKPNTTTKPRPNTRVVSQDDDDTDKTEKAEDAQALQQVQKLDKKSDKPKKVADN